MSSEKHREALKLGLFMPNCSYAYSISTYKLDPYDWTFDSNVRIARAAETAGFDFLFPVAKWRGYGGKTDYLGTSLETMTWAGAMLARTSRIRVFSTVHVPMFHPFVAAKMGATLDHIGKGRWGLNVVSGWSEREFAQMAIPVLPHRERYRRTAAYIEVVKGLWTAEPGTFSYDSQWYKIINGFISPMPVQRPHPPIANAGVSEDAKELVARLCDWAFISPFSFETVAPLTTEIKARARDYDREVKCCCYPFVLWRDSERAAEEEIARLKQNIDIEAARNWSDGLAGHSGSFGGFSLEMFAVGAGALPVVGSTEQVASKLRDLYRAGMDGILMVFLDYYNDTLRFQREIMPLLRQMEVIR
jgi:FMNH2-dependent dimethyl sulfone monooxygenase